MRIFEILLIIFSAITLGLTLFKRYRRNSGYFLTLSLLIFLAQYFYEQPRWQMIPAYGCLFLLFFLISRPSIIKFVSAILLLSIASFLIYSFPVIKLPKPTGPYNIGTITQYWADPERPEWFTPEDQNDIRELIVQIWYPAQSNQEGIPAPYIDHLKIRTKAIGAAGGFPGFLVSYLGMTKTNARLEVSPLSEAAPFPLIIISHGITGMRSIHTSIAENLASHGYIVAAPDHSYDANLTVFPDGRIADYRSDLTLHPDSANIRRRQLETRVADLSFIINQFEKVENGDISSSLTGYIDLNNIAAMGHSFGGATCIQAAKTDQRIKACLVLDGWINPIPGSTLETGILQPFLFIGRPSWDSSDYPANFTRLKTLMDNNQNEQTWITIKNTRHLDFTDIPLFSPYVSRFLEVGTINKKTVVSLVNQIALEFFEQSIREVPSPILTEKQIIPDITIH